MNNQTVLYKISLLCLLGFTTLISACKKETPAPTAQFGYNLRPQFPNNNPRVAPTTLLLENTSVETGTMEYTWDFGDGSTSKEKNPQHTYTQPNTYTVSLTAKSEGGSSVKTEKIQIFAPLSFTIAPTVVLRGDSVQFTNTSPSVAGLIYSWDFGDGTYSSAPNPKHVYTTTGTYNVQLNGYASGQSFSTGQSIIVNTNYTACRLNSIHFLQIPFASTLDIKIRAYDPINNPFSQPNDWSGLYNTDLPLTKYFTQTNPIRDFAAQTRVVMDYRNGNWSPFNYTFYFKAQDYAPTIPSTASSQYASFNIFENGWSMQVRLEYSQD